ALLMEQFEREVASLPHVANYLTTVGADSQQRPDRANILVQLTPMETRELSQMDVMLMARERLVAKFPQLAISVQPPSAISGGGFVNADLQYSVQGPDLDEINAVSERLIEVLGEQSGVADLDSTYEPGKPELRAVIDRDKAADLGVTA